MNSNDKNIYEIIEQYLSGTLPEDQKALFEAKLASDDALKQKVEVCKSSKELILQNKLRNLKSIMAEEQRRVDNNNKPFNKIWTVLIIATLASGTFFIIKRDEDKSEKEVAVKSDKTESNKTTESSEPLESPQPVKTEIANKQKNVVAGPIEKNIEQSVPVLTKTEDKGAADKSNPEPVKIAIDEPKKAEKRDDVDTKVKANSPEPVDICHGVKISGDVETEDPCNGQHNGRIELRDLKGGTAPYTAVINGKSVGNEFTFSSLNTGSYHISIFDINGCKQLFNTIILRGKNCNLNYDFNPGRGEEWQGPIVQASKLTIFNKEGSAVYSKQMHDGEQCTWSGYSNTGLLVHGYFVFIIENQDGTVTKGSITVTE